MERVFYPKMVFSVKPIQDIKSFNQGEFIALLKTCNLIQNTQLSRHKIRKNLNDILKVN